MNEELELEDFEDTGETIDDVLAASEAVTFMGVDLMLTDAVMMAAQSIGLKLFNLSEDKLLDAENAYDGQLTDAIVTLFCCFCEAGEVPQGVANPDKWRKMLRTRTLGSAAMRPRMFEQALAEFANDFAITQDIEATFEAFNELWSHAFKTDVTLPGSNGSGKKKEQPTSEERGEQP